MIESFKVSNIRCNGCANSIKKALKDKFGEVQIDIENKKVTLDIESIEDRDILRNTLRKLGYPLNDEKLTTFQNIGLKAVSVASCSIGKFHKN